LVQQKWNSVDFSLITPYLTLSSSGPKGRQFHLSLFMDEGLFGLKLEPLQMNDSRYSRYPKCDVTPGGIFAFRTSATPEPRESESRAETCLPPNVGRTVAVLEESTEEQENRCRKIASYFQS
jgi:hypothetical protein